MSRAIVHLDADAFFAAVEQASDPKLRGKPVAVGGEQRGIIASASYEARKFGVYTPMPTVRARKLCPKLIVLPGDFERYEQFSNWMFGYCYDFTPDVEQTSIDEGYFDLSSARKSPVEIALTIRHAIGQKLKITVSEGLATNKLVSAVASKLNKPAAFNEVPPGGEASFLQPLPNQWLPGVGPKTSGRLNAAGLPRIGHIAATPLDMLQLLLGNQAATLRQFAHGIDDRPLIPVREPQKSFSQQETFAQDLTDEEYLHAVLRRMADQLFARVREENHSIRTLTVKVRYNDMAEDQVNESLGEPTDLETDVYGRLRAMLRQAWKRRVSLRLVSLKLSNVYDGLFRSELPLEMPVQRRESRERLARVVDDLRHTYGGGIVLRGHDFVLKSEVRSPKSEVKSAWQTSADTSLEPRRSRRSRPVGMTSRTVEVSLLTSASTSANRTSPNRKSQTLMNSDESRADREHATKVGVANRKSTCVPLRVHSHYSFLDSTLSPAAMVGLAKQHGLSAVALTDTGNLHGAVEFVEAAKAADVKPILGVELRVDDQPLLLYVESAVGYRNLCRLLSRKDEGRMMNAEMAVADQQRASVPAAFFLQHSAFLDGLIAIGADARLAELFPERFYQMATKRSVSIAHPDHERGRDALLRVLAERQLGPTRLMGRAGDKDLPVVACPAIHYATPAERQRYDILQSIRTLTLLRQEHPDKRLGGRFHFRTPAEMAAGCREHPDWQRHTLEIAERCTSSFPSANRSSPPSRRPMARRPVNFCGAWCLTVRNGVTPNRKLR